MTRVSVSESSKIDARRLILDMLGKTPEIRNGVAVHMLNDSKLWYQSTEQAKAYLATDDSEDYKRGMHDAEHNLLNRNMGKIIALMEDQVSIIDLGCGNARMTIDIVKRAELKGRNIAFYLVDISHDILSTAVQNAQAAGIANVRGLEGDFEKLDELLVNVGTERQRFFNLGANFVNFDSDKILSIIRANMRDGDLVYFSAQLGNGNSDAIVKQYSANPSAVGMTLGALAFVGVFPENVDYNARMNPATREIECFVTVKELSEDLRSVGVKVGSEIVVITSFKPTLEKFKEIANRYFEGEFLLNEEGTYVGFVGRKKSA